jgi:hypothetical protein
MRSQLQTFVRGRDKESPATLACEPSGHGPNTQTVCIGLDHSTALRRRRGIVHSMVVSRKRIEIDCHDSGLHN